MREIKFRQWVGDRFYHWGIGIGDNTFVGPVSGGGVNAQNTVHQAAHYGCDWSVVKSRIYENPELLTTKEAL